MKHHDFEFFKSIIFLPMKQLAESKLTWSQLFHGQMMTVFKKIEKTAKIMQFFIEKSKQTTMILNFWNKSVNICPWNSWYQVSLPSFSFFMCKKWFKIMVFRAISLRQWKMIKNDINFSLFSIILKNSQVTIYQWIKTFFCSLANVGLTNFSRIFFLGDSQGW